MTTSAGPLPPNPDRSGEPRPPAAPRVTGPWRGERFRLRSAHLAEADGRFVDSAVRQYPLLETVWARRPDRWRYAAGQAIVMVSVPAVVIGTVVWLVAPDRVQSLLIWAAVVAVGWALAFLFRASDPTVLLRAGAHAVAAGDSYDTGVGESLVVYRLSSVAVTDSRGGLALRLVGPAPGKKRLVIPFGLIEGNQRLWDLVYNGIRHSVAEGAVADDHTRRVLKLPPSNDQNLWMCFGKGEPSRRMI